MFALCLLIEKIAFSYSKVTNSDPKVTHNYSKVTYSGPGVTHSDPAHLPLPPPSPPEPHLAIS